MKFTYLFGNKGRRKFRAPVFTDKKARDTEAAAHKSLGFRVRKVDIGRGITKKVV